MKDFVLQPCLIGDLIELRPLKEQDFEELYQCASDPKIWEQHPEPTRYKSEVFQKYFDGAIKCGGAVAILDRETNKIIGSSRFYDFKKETREVCIGYTFLRSEYWGGKYNRELKLLMLNHAFQFVDRVIFHIGANNHRSRTAIERIGARFQTSQVLDGNPHVIYSINPLQFASST